MVIGGSSPQVAPALQVSEWLNTSTPISLEELRGRIVVIEAFQMLCPGCVAHGIPQAKQIHEAFPSDVVVLGLHTVFEHHAAMTPVSLKAFLHEYRIAFPVGVDEHDGDEPLPKTMAAYAMRGTPTLIVIDRVGRLRAQHFGQATDLRVGALLGSLINEPTGEEPDD